MPFYQIFKHYSVILISFLLILSSCSNSKNLSQEEVVWSLEIKKGGCLDVCESYSILIKSNAQYSYRGIYKVKHLGEKTGKLEQADLNQLKKYVEAVNWEGLDQNYGNQANDSQRKEMNYTSKTVTKKVVYFRLETQEMRTIEHFIDQLIDRDEF